jgi:long-chain-fatty-acid---luciferin-component ligase
VRPAAVENAPLVREAARNRRAPDALEVLALEVASEIDRVIFGVDDEAYFHRSLAEQRQLRHRFVVDALRHHAERTPAYRAYLERSALSPSELEGLDDASIDLDRIPLIPTSAFKRASIKSEGCGEHLVRCKSSGTRGPESVVERDRTSLERLLGSVASGMLLVDSWYEHELSILNLGPDGEETNDIWFPYVLSLVELLYPTTPCVRGGRFDAPFAARELASLLDRSPAVGITGPPFLLLDLIEHLRAEKQTISAGARLHVLTSGGWKRHSGKRVPRDELEARAIEALGLEGRDQLRDAFNQVELNSVFFECSALRKHIPPWVYATARDPSTLSVLPQGEVGLLAYLDASAASYPAFIVGDDVGAVNEGMCACGREAVTIRVDRRVEGRVQRGCALTIDRRLGQGAP